MPKQGNPFMQIRKPPRVAVLLATYNGAEFVEAQIKSLTDNSTAFCVHWLDDHSTDKTREVVRDAARNLGIDLKEWHRPQHCGVPDAFFLLLESADADVYLFCDQDDIWQPGKIDVTVESLLPDIASPAICFSDPLMFYNDEPQVFYRLSKVLDMKAPAALQASRAFMTNPSAGQSIGLTKPLRDLYLRHKDIARTHAFMHSWWMYIIANASGQSRMLHDAPTTLYRQHGSNVTTPFYSRSRKGIRHLIATWRLQHRWRCGMSKQARGFILASDTLEPGPKLERLLSLARLVATLDKRQSPLALVRLAFRGAMWPSWRRMLWLSAACLCSDAKP
jgi:glycosyltransferase involved in cell wall biosynthesis